MSWFAESFDGAKGAPRGDSPRKTYSGTPGATYKSPYRKELLDGSRRLTLKDFRDKGRDDDWNSAFSSAQRRRRGKGRDPTSPRHKGKLLSYDDYYTSWRKHATTLTHNEGKKVIPVETLPYLVDPEMFDDQDGTQRARTAPSFSPRDAALYGIVIANPRRPKTKAQKRASRLAHLRKVYRLGEVASEPDNIPGAEPSSGGDRDGITPWGHGNDQTASDYQYPEGPWIGSAARVNVDPLAPHNVPSGERELVADLSPVAKVWKFRDPALAKEARNTGALHHRDVQSGDSESAQLALWKFTDGSDSDQSPIGRAAPGRRGKGKGKGIGQGRGKGKGQSNTSTTGSSIFPGMAPGYMTHSSIPSPHARARMQDVEMGPEDHLPPSRRAQFQRSTPTCAPSGERQYRGLGDRDSNLNVRIPTPSKEQQRQAYHIQSPRSPRSDTSSPIPRELGRSPSPRGSSALAGRREYTIGAVGIQTISSPQPHQQTRMYDSPLPRTNNPSGIVTPTVRAVWSRASSRNASPVPGHAFGSGTASPSLNSTYGASALQVSQSLDSTFGTNRTRLDSVAMSDMESEVDALVEWGRQLSFQNFCEDNGMEWMPNFDFVADDSLIDGRSVLGT